MHARTQICKNTLELEEKFSFPAAEMFRLEFEQQEPNYSVHGLKWQFFSKRSAANR